MARYDLVIAGGRVVDGSGSAPKLADIGIVGETIVAVEPNLLGAHDRAERVISARDRLVTPGFVDIHTHYDAQATWDPNMTPSSQHGVTTVVMGSCGVGFAPVKPDEHEWLIGLMEGVEDIPGSAMVEGIRWAWESFPEYLDALEKMPRVLDVGTQIAHGPLRAFVMGARGAKNEKATAAERNQMKYLATEALRCGALGVSTSRTSLHRAIDGELVPGSTADAEELFALGDAMRAAGHGIFVAACENRDVPRESEMLAELSRRSGRPVTLNLSQIEEAPDLWREGLARIEAEQANGAQLFAQVAGRAIGVVMGLELTANPLMLTSTYLEMLGASLSDKVQALRDVRVREKLLRDDALDLGALGKLVLERPDKIWLVGEEIDYEPKPEDSIAAIAVRKGVTAREVALDALLEHEGRGFLYRPLFNYAEDHLHMVREAQLHPYTIMGLSDAGAHCGAICDGGMPTFMLSFWARDRKRGESLPLEYVVKRQTRDTARFFGLNDRGVLAPGYRADLNVIDFDRLALKTPRVVYDLPAGGRRLLQDARGYAYTCCRGQITVEGDELTGALPGRLLRGPQSGTPLA